MQLESRYIFYDGTFSTNLNTRFGRPFLASNKGFLLLQKQLYSFRMKEPQVLEGNFYRLVEKVLLCLLRFSRERVEQASLPIM